MFSYCLSCVQSLVSNPKPIDEEKLEDLLAVMKTIQFSLLVPFSGEENQTHLSYWLSAGAGKKYEDAMREFNEGSNTLLRKNSKIIVEYEMAMVGLSNTACKQAQDPCNSLLLFNDKALKKFFTKYPEIFEFYYQQLVEKQHSFAQMNRDYVEFYKTLKGIEAVQIPNHVQHSNLAVKMLLTEANNKVAVKIENARVERPVPRVFITVHGEPEHFATDDHEYVEAVTQLRAQSRAFSNKEIIRVITELRMKDIAKVNKDESKCENFKDDDQLRLPLLINS